MAKSAPVMFPAAGAVNRVAAAHQLFDSCGAVGATTRSFEMKDLSDLNERVAVPARRLQRALAGRRWPDYHGYRSARLTPAAA